MNAVDVLSRISSTHLLEADLRYCLVSDDKRPYKIDDTMAKPNQMSDFVDFETLLQHTSLESYAGVGISIQASNIFAIDVDHCFETAFDVMSGDNRAKDLLERFADYAYCEFSFSGKGLRILFRHKVMDDYSAKYYIKNERHGIEFYQPSRSFRYVTVTGMTISDNQILDEVPELDEIIHQFLEDYMLRPVRVSFDVKTQAEETRTFEQLMVEVKRLYFKNRPFQDSWFAIAPGSGKDESEKDYKLIALLYENITQDKALIKKIFEASPYFKTKDSKHIFKWNYQEGRYFNYVYDMIRRTKP